MGLGDVRATRTAMLLAFVGSSLRRVLSGNPLTRSKAVRRHALALGASALLTISQTAAAKPYHALYVFGDSYSDMGARILDSNGPTAVAYLAQHMGIAMVCPMDAHVDSKSINFAAAGAKTGNEPAMVFNGRYWCCQGIMDQVEDFARRVRSGFI